MRDAMIAVAGLILAGLVNAAAIRAMYGKDWLTPEPETIDATATATATERRVVGTDNVTAHTDTAREVLGEPSPQP